MKEVLDRKELDSLDKLNERYEKLTKPSQLSKLGERTTEIIWNKYRQKKYETRCYERWAHMEFVRCM